MAKLDRAKRGYTWRRDGGAKRRQRLVIYTRTDTQTDFVGLRYLVYSKTITYTDASSESKE